MSGVPIGDLELELTGRARTHVRQYAQPRFAARPEVAAAFLAMRAAAAQYKAALHILAPTSSLWSTPVVTISGLTGEGLDALWAKIEKHRDRFEAKGLITEKRRRQDVKWMWAMVQDRLQAKLRHDPALKARTPELEASVSSGELAPTLAAEEIAKALGL